MPALEIPNVDQKRLWINTSLRQIQEINKLDKKMGWAGGAPSQVAN